MARRSRDEWPVHRLGRWWVAVLELQRAPNGRRVRRRRFAATKTGALQLLREMKREVGQTGSTSDTSRSVADAVGRSGRPAMGRSEGTRRLSMTAGCSMSLSTVWDTSE